MLASLALAWVAVEFGTLRVFALMLMVVFLVWARAGSAIHVFFPVGEQPGWREFLTFFGIGSAVGSIFAIIVFVAATREEKSMVISWDERYGTEEYFYGTEPNDFLRGHCAQIRRGGEVLCLAEGEGRNAVFLAQQGFRPLAVDQSPVGLAKAMKLATARGVHLDALVADLAVYQIEPGHWDGIVSIWCHLPSALRTAVHRQVVAGLKTGGVFLLEAYTPAQLVHGTGGPKDVDLLPTLAGLREELAGLEFLHAEERERVIHEGPGHAGLSSVVQVVARRRG